MGRTFEQLVRGLMIRDWEVDRDGHWIQPSTKKALTFQQAVAIEYGTVEDGQDRPITVTESGTPITPEMIDGMKMKVLDAPSYPDPAPQSAQSEQRENP